MSTELSKKRLRLPKVVLFAGAIMLLFAANWVGRFFSTIWQTNTKETASQPAPAMTLTGLKVEKRELELGDVWESPNHFVKLILENVTGEPISILNFNTGCECTKVLPDTLTVASGQRSEVEVLLNLTLRSPHQYGAARRELSVDVVPNVQGKGVAAGSWSLRGTICSRAALVDRVLQFGDLAVHGGKPVSKTVSCLIHEPGARIEASLSPELGIVTVTPAAGKPLSSQITVTPNPKTPVGKYHFNVPITVIRADGIQEAGPILEVDGDMSSPFQITPSQVLLGEHPVGTTVEAEFNVTLPPTSDFAVKQVSTDLAETTVRLLRDEVDRADGRRLTYVVGQRIAKVGDKTTEVAILLSNAKGEKQTVRVRIAFSGTESAPDKIPGKKEKP